MDPATIVAAVNAALSLAAQIIPLIDKKNSTAIGNVISDVTAIAPAATTLITNGYAAVKNLISNLGSHPATTEDQLAALQALDAQVDAAWEAVRPQFDPDYQPPQA